MTPTRQPNSLIVPFLRTTVAVSDRHLWSTMLTARHNVRTKRERELCRQIACSGV